MIDIKAEIESERQLKESTYILLKDLIELIKKDNPESTYQEIGHVLYNKFCSQKYVNGFHLPATYPEIGLFPPDVHFSDLLVALAYVREYEGNCESLSQCWQGREYYFSYSVLRAQVDKILNTTITPELINAEYNTVIVGLKNEIYSLKKQLEKQSAGKLEQEIARLKAEIESKDRIIEEQTQSAPKSGKADTTKNAFIKALLKIHYGDDVAENPRPHVYDPNSSAKSKDGRIQKDFDLLGLSEYLPSGQTLNNWVKSVDL